MKKLFLLMFVAGLGFTACKKDGCTNPLATNYDSKAKKDDGSCKFDSDPTQSTLCQGKSTLNSYLPIGDTYKWTYDRTVLGVKKLYSEEVQGTETVNGIEYYKVHFINNHIGSDGYIHYRTDTNGNVYLRGTNEVEELVMVANPAVGTSIGDGQVTNISAAISTSACQYTGLIEVTYSGGLGETKKYYKKGLGLVKVLEPANTENEIVGVNL